MGVSTEMYCQKISGVGSLTPTSILCLCMALVQLEFILGPEPILQETEPQFGASQLLSNFITELEG